MYSNNTLAIEQHSNMWGRNNNLYHIHRCPRKSHDVLIMYYREIVILQTVMRHYRLIETTWPTILTSMRESSIV